MRASSSALGVFVFFLCCTSAAVAQDQPAIARYVPPAPDARHVFVLDSAHILGETTIAALQDSARALQAATRADVVWVTLPTLGGRSVEEAALYIGRTWKVGNAGAPGDPQRNRGLVILYVPDKTTTAGPNFRIEVGNGLEGTITDGRSRTITNAMRENLRAKRYDAAYLAGWGVAAELVRQDFAAAGAPVPAPQPVAPLPPMQQPRNGGGAGAFFLFPGLFMIVLAIAIVNAQRRRRATIGGRRYYSSFTPPVPVSVNDDDSLRRSTAAPTSFDFGSSSSPASDGGSLGGGGGFSGGGSSDTI